MVLANNYNNLEGKLHKQKIINAIDLIRIKSILKNTCKYHFKTQNPPKKKKNSSITMTFQKLFITLNLAVHNVTRK